MAGPPRLGTSNDPEFTTKMARVLDLYDHPPADGRVVCVDEFGPLNLKPRTDAAGSRLETRSGHRTQSLRHMFGALDLAAGHLYYHIRDRKRRIEFLAFSKFLHAH